MPENSIDLPELTSHLGCMIHAASRPWSPPQHRRCPCRFATRIRHTRIAVGRTQASEFWRPDRLRSKRKFDVDPANAECLRHGQIAGENSPPIQQSAGIRQDESSPTTPRGWSATRRKLDPASPGMPSRSFGGTRLSTDVESTWDRCRLRGSVGLRSGRITRLTGESSCPLST